MESINRPCGGERRERKVYVRVVCALFASEALREEI